MNLKKIIWLLFFVLLLVIVIESQNYLSKEKKIELEEEAELYLPEIPYLKFISLGFDQLIADFVLAKALTYYGEHYFQRHTFKFKHLKKLFFTAVEMDPYNKEAFLMGNNILKTVDPSSRSSIEILKIGLRYHPDNWKFSEMIGFNYYYSLDEPEFAGRYYEIAANKYDHQLQQPTPQGPSPYVASLSGKFYEESGKYREALRVLKNFYETTNDKRLKKSFLDLYKGVLKRISLRDNYIRKNVDIINTFVKIQIGAI